jgi:hypothetical protein
VGSAVVLAVTGTNSTTHNLSPPMYYYFWLPGGNPLQVMSWLSIGVT